MQNTLAVISLKTIRKNAELIKNMARVPLCAVVKDDAYGHGAVAVAAAIEERVSFFAVATAGEGAALRIGGITKNILVLSPAISKEEALQLCAYGLTATISSLAALRLLERTAREYGYRPEVHLALNTGMNRYGFRTQVLKRALKEITLPVTGVYSHLYAAESEPFCEEQLALFLKGAALVRAQFPTALRHLSATGGALLGERYRFDAVRCGIALYGYLPKGFEGALKVKPAMRVYAPVSQSNVYLPGGVGYRRAQREYFHLHTVRCGYGDGFFRTASGNVCMDATVREKRGRFGEWRLVLKNASEYAKEHGTTAYEVLTRIGGEAVKYYLD